MGSPKKAGGPQRGQESDSPLPSIQERLANLQPSKELLEFYRKKIAQFDGEQEELMQMLQKFREGTEDQHKLQSEVRQREGEIAELQKALSDIQAFLFQEREQSLRLYAENDRLKIRELEDRRKIQLLLTLISPDAGDVTYFHREPPHKVSIKQRNPKSDQGDNLNLRPTKLRPAPSKKENGRKTKTPDGTDAESLEHYKDENQTLLLQVEALQAQMEEQTRLAKEQVESLMADRKIQAEEAQAQKRRDKQHIQSLSDKLKKTQNLLYESTKDFLQLKFETRAQEKVWMAEKDQLLKEVPRQGKAGSPVRRRPAPSNAASQPPQPEARMQKDEKKAMQENLKEAHRLAQMYREQCVNLESEVAKLREEVDLSRELHKDRTEKMAKRLQLMTKRYEALEKRRVMEVEGFKTDLKHLRQKFKAVETQLAQVATSIAPNQDLLVLQEVRETNSRTKKAQSELMALKAKIYRLENELRLG
ncbi:coiled-coil domain-containing protein 77 isoform X1 [Synchiropus splendidus]|uniref:coiled-coil domain-containing protein 77 isoform X1 n=1 Tax=Synchiropus splendidus TaxID=270530 RepID=UPI00237DF486|nr:coiled-coil domain-containing protein 77 isoform X1 [Synchiropus splendidus]